LTEVPNFAKNDVPKEDESPKGERIGNGEKDASGNPLPEGMLRKYAKMSRQEKYAEIEKIIKFKLYRKITRQMLAKDFGIPVNDLAIWLCRHNINIHNSQYGSVSNDIMQDAINHTNSLTNAVKYLISNEHSGSYAFDTLYTIIGRKIRNKELTLPYDRRTPPVFGDEMKKRFVTLYNREHDKGAKSNKEILMNIAPEMGVGLHVLLRWLSELESSGKGKELGLRTIPIKKYFTGDQENPMHEKIYKEVEEMVASHPEMTHNDIFADVAKKNGTTTPFVRKIVYNYAKQMRLLGPNMTFVRKYNTSKHENPQPSDKEIDDKFQTDVLDMFRHGKTIASIASATDATTNDVYAVLRKNGINPYEKKKDNTKLTDANRTYMGVSSAGRGLEDNNVDVIAGESTARKIVGIRINEALNRPGEEISAPYFSDDVNEFRSLFFGSDGTGIDSPDGVDLNYIAWKAEKFGKAHAVGPEMKSALCTAYANVFEDGKPVPSFRDFSTDYGFVTSIFMRVYAEKSHFNMNEHSWVYDLLHRHIANGLWSRKNEIYELLGRMAADSQSWRIK
jgi:hypothetical protein